MQGDVRVGTYRYKLAEGVDDSTLGVSFRRFPMTIAWNSVFAQRTATSGGPGVQNLKAEDLRWLITSFDGGEGQAVIDATSEASFHSFLYSTGIDLSQPGQMQLAKAMTQIGASGGAATTDEGSAWTDDIGTSTVVNTTDRRLNAINDRIKDTLTLAANTYQVDLYAYRDVLPLTLGKDLEKKTGTGEVDVVGNQKKLKTEGVIVQTAALDPTNGVKVTVKFDVEVDSAGTAKFTYDIWDVTDGKVVDSTTDTVTFVTTTRGGPGTPTTSSKSITFNPKDGATYRYRVTLTSLTSGLGAAFVNQISYIENSSKELTWELLDAGVVKASGTVDLTDVTTSKIVASTTFLGDAVGPWVVRAKRTDGKDVKIIVDKAVYQIVTLGDPRCIELGLSNRTWIVDYKAAAAPSVLYWKQETAAWTAVAALGAPAGSKAIAMAHSDNYEFIAMDDKKIYRAQLPTTVAQYTAAAGDPIVGITVGGNRLLILTENVANGTNLYAVATEGVPNVALGAAIPVGNSGINPDTELPQRMAATVSGCVFFVNQSADCFLYNYDGSTLAPMSKTPPGFKGRAIVHGNGLSWVGGGFPSVDINGNVRYRPAIFAFDATGNLSELDVSMFRVDDDPTFIHAMQLYGSDLWVLAEVSSTLPKLRLWRISLKGGSPAAFLQQEITVDQAQVAGHARGLAVTWQEKFVMWSTGNPYLEASSYPAGGDNLLTTSVYDFNLTENKRIEAVDVVGAFPAGTSVRISTSLDGGAFELVGTLTSSGSLTVSTPDDTVTAHSLSVQIQLLTTDTAVTPTVHNVGVRGYVTSYSKTIDLILDTSEANSVRNMDGLPIEGSVGAQYLFDLADTGALVEFEDRFSSDDVKNPRIATVAIQNPERILFTNGDGALRVTLLERNT